MTRHVSIIGDGAMATVCGLTLHSRGIGATMWSPLADNAEEMIQTRENRRFLPGYPIPDKIRLTAEVEHAFADADFIVSAIPSQYIRDTWRRLAPHCPADVPIVSVTKGVERETMLRPSQIIAEALREAGEDPDKPARPMAALSGPTVADELAQNLPATAVAASEDDDFARTVQKAFTTEWFRIYTNRDLLGVELAGATKNVIAVAAGILDGLKAGNNAKSALLARGLAEIARLGMAMGASQETFFGVAGVGDLATTCFSPTGRNRTCGEQLGRGRKLEDVLEEIPGVVEGVPTTQAVVALAKRYKVDMPITESLAQVLFEGLDPLEGISRLMSRETKPERVA
jgi:glycerol-3-phosphate dehydrogenase (NAD(P)+)